MWHQFFGEGKLIPYYIDYLTTPDWRLKGQKCIEKFKIDYPRVPVNVYFGDQSNSTFLGEVVTESGGNFDVVIDDGGHTYPLIMASFHFLWKHVVPGGVYVVEDVNALLNDEIEVFAGWAMALMHCNAKNEGFEACSQKTGTHKGFNVEKPVDLVSVECWAAICVFRKK